MISVGRDGLLVKLAPAAFAFCSTLEDDELIEIAGLPPEVSRDLPLGTLLGRAVGSLVADAADAMLREWRERDDMSERNARRSA